MRTTAIDDPGVCQSHMSVCLSVTLPGRAKTAERIDVLFEVETLGDQRNNMDLRASLTLRRGLCQITLARMFGCRFTVFLDSEAARRLLSRHQRIYRPLTEPGFV